MKQIFIVAQIFILAFVGTAKSQTIRKTLSVETNVISLVTILSDIDTKEFKGIQTSNDSEFVVLYGDSRILIVDTKQDNLIIDLHQPNVIAAGFIDKSTIGIVTSRKGSDSLYVFNHVLGRVVHSFKIPNPQIVKAKMYSVFSDSVAYYICSLNDAITWTHDQKNHALVRAEQQCIYGNYSGDILKHLYTKTSDVSYATQKLHTNIILENRDFRPPITPTCQSINPSGNKILFVDGFGSGPKTPSIYIFDTKTNNLIYSATTGNLVYYASFINDKQYVALEFSNDNTSIIVIRNIEGKVLSEKHLDKKVGDIRLSSDKKSLTFLTNPEHEVYIAQFE